MEDMEIVFIGFYIMCALYIVYGYFRIIPSENN